KPMDENHRRPFTPDAHMNSGIPGLYLLSHDARSMNLRAGRHEEGENCKSRWKDPKHGTVVSMFLSGRAVHLERQLGDGYEPALMLLHAFGFLNPHDLPQGGARQSGSRPRIFNPDEVASLWNHHLPIQRT